jgi:hypothetical protein
MQYRFKQRVRSTFRIVHAARYLRDDGLLTNEQEALADGVLG